MIAAEWAKVKQDTPAWYWICDAAHYGDLYQVCAFAAAFRDHHGWRFPLYIIATSRTQADVAALFGKCFDKVIVAPGLQGQPDDWSRFYAEQGLPAFGINTPIVVFPVLNPVNASLWDFTIEQNEISVLPLIRRMLHLPNHTEPYPPSADADRQKRARALCELAGIVENRSVVLCPYARSDPADATADFTLLARELKRAGYTVFTSVADDEHSIEGTAPVRIPFSLLPDVAFYAGWIIAVRSGVADVVSGAACRKSIIYQSLHSLRNWSLAVLGLCRDAHELVFRFGGEASESFVNAVIGGGSRNDRRRRTAPSEALRPTRSINFSDLNSSSSEFFRRWFRRPIDVLQITDVPSRYHSQAWASRQQAITALGKFAGANAYQILARREGSSVDVYEPVESAALADRQYYGAGFWHTLLLVNQRGFDKAKLATAVLPDSPIVFANELSPAGAFGSQGHRDLLSGRLPLCHGGLQFLDGWSDLEGWGIWSISCLSTLKVLLPEAPAGCITVQLTASVAAFSALMPLLAFSITANEIEVGSFELPGAAEPHKITFPVPMHVIQGRRSMLLRFKFPYILSPQQQQVGSSDTRTIGLGLHRLRLDPR